MFCEESKQQHLFKFTDNTHGNSDIITRLFANSVLQKTANNGFLSFSQTTPHGTQMALYTKYFVFYEKFANNRYQNFGRSHLVKKYGKGLAIFRNKNSQTMLLHVALEVRLRARPM